MDFIIYTHTYPQPNPLKCDMSKPNQYIYPQYCPPEGEVPECIHAVITCIRVYTHSPTTWSEVPKLTFQTVEDLTKVKRSAAVATHI